MMTLQQPIELEPTDKWMQHLAALRLSDSPSQGKRLSWILLKLGHGYEPTRELMKELVVRGFDWVPTAYANHWSAFHGCPLDLAALLPTPEELMPVGHKNRRLDGPRYTYRLEGQPFIGVTVKKKRCLARIRVGKQNAIILGYGSAAECASMYDTAVRERGTGGRLNFKPEPSTPFELPIARPAPHSWAEAA
jgi:hypothetical protein